MTDFVSLTCQACGSKLEVGNDTDHFACSSCGTEYLVRRGGGIVSLKPVLESLERIEKYTSRTMNELVTRRLAEDIKRSQSKICKFFLGNETQKAFAKQQLAWSLSAARHISWLDSFFITPEAVIDKLLKLNAEELQHVLQIEKKRIFKNHDAIKALQEHIEVLQSLEDEEDS
ncbi:MAG: hypothetical protein KF701_00945 [Anaerolineales bacterium]|nr:MAG: hypothetical protein KF701_00945 [Anaerolineales bacterium]